MADVEIFEALFLFILYITMSEDGGEGRSQLLRVGEEIVGIILFLTQIFGQHVNR